jgi:hypothetical protein
MFGTNLYFFFCLVKIDEKKNYQPFSVTKKKTKKSFEHFPYFNVKKNYSNNSSIDICTNISIPLISNYLSSFEFNTVDFHFLFLFFYFTYFFFFLKNANKNLYIGFYF